MTYYENLGKWVILFLGENGKQYKKFWAKRDTSEKRMVIFGRK